MSKRIRIQLSSLPGGLRVLSNTVTDSKDQDSFWPKDGDWIDIEEVRPGDFEVVGNSFTGDEDRYELGICDWDDEVENLDGSSDESWLGLSCSLRWNDVEIAPYCFEAPTLERLLEALEHVSFCAWDPWDI